MDTPTTKTQHPRDHGTRKKRVVISAVLDVCMVILFVAIGRRSHDEGGALRQIASTAAPFLVGLTCGWVAMRAWRRPMTMITGVGIWIITLVIGMLLRRFVAHGGTATPFVIVATLFLGVTLVGWRAIASLSSRFGH